MILSAGAFDAWGSNVVSGLLGVTAALVAIWLTRRFDKVKTLDEAALAAAESMNMSVAQFYKNWSSINVIPPDQWYNRLLAETVDARVALAIKSPAIRDKRLEDYLKTWSAFMTASLAEAKGLIKKTTSAPDYDESTFDWSSLHPQFSRIDERIGEACKELTNLLIHWRSSLAFDASKAGQAFVADFDNRRKFADPVSAYVEN